MPPLLFVGEHQINCRRLLVHLLDVDLACARHVADPAVVEHLQLLLHGRHITPLLLRRRDEHDLRARYRAALFVAVIKIPDEVFVPRARVRADLMQVVKVELLRRHADAVGRHTVFEHRHHDALDKPLRALVPNRVFGGRYGAERGDDIDDLLVRLVLQALDLRTGSGVDRVPVVLPPVQAVYGYAALRYHRDPVEHALRLAHLRPCVPKRVPAQRALGMSEIERQDLITVLRQIPRRLFVQLALRVGKEK